MEKSQGFVTLAAGDERYYKLASNLLKSYKMYAKGSCKPFAIFADRENEYTDLFDKVIIMEKPSLSYMDKLKMLQNPPFSENIFIDADCLAYANLNDYWNFVSGLGGIRCFGHSLPLDSENGWFELSGIGEYAKSVSFIPQMHGGIIYFCDDELSKAIYLDTLKIAENYRKYKFKYFSNPADEPILALTMAIHDCRPIELEPDIQNRMFCFLPSVKQEKHDISKGFLQYKIDENCWCDNVYLLHWQNIFTKTPSYYKEILRLNSHNSGIFTKTVRLKLKYIGYYVKYHVGIYSKRVKNKILRILEKKK